MRIRPNTYRFDNYIPRSAPQVDWWGVLSLVLMFISFSIVVALWFWAFK